MPAPRTNPGARALGAFSAGIMPGASRAGTALADIYTERAQHERAREEALRDALMQAGFPVGRPQEDVLAGFARERRSLADLAAAQMRATKIAPVERPMLGEGLSSEPGGVPALGRGGEPSATAEGLRAALEAPRRRAATGAGLPEETYPFVRMREPAKPEKLDLTFEQQMALRRAGRGRGGMSTLDRARQDARIVTNRRLAEAREERIRAFADVKQQIGEAQQRNEEAKAYLKVHPTPEIPGIDFFAAPDVRARAEQEHAERARWADPAFLQQELDRIVESRPPQPSQHEIERTSGEEAARRWQVQPEHLGITPRGPEPVPEDFEDWHEYLRAYDAWERQ